MSRSGSTGGGVDPLPKLSFDELSRDLRLAARDETAFRDVQMTGDADFAAEIAFLAKNLKWDVEEDLSKVMGDAAAHRAVGAATAAATAAATFDVPERADPA